MKLDHPKTIRRLAAIKAATTSKPLSVNGIARALRACHQTALRYVNHLVGDNPEIGDQMHICKWREIERGKWAALYMWGSGPNAPKPAPRTRLQLTREWRQHIRKDQVRYALHLARQRGLYRANRASKTPQSWASALFVVAKQGRQHA